MAKGHHHPACSFLSIKQRLLKPQILLGTIGWDDYRTIMWHLYILFTATLLFPITLAVGTVLVSNYVAMSRTQVFKLFFIKSLRFFSIKIYEIFFEWICKNFHCGRRPPIKFISLRYLDMRIFLIIFQSLRFMALYIPQKIGCNKNCNCKIVLKIVSIIQCKFAGNEFISLKTYVQDRLTDSKFQFSDE